MVTSVSVRATIIDDNTGIKTQLPIVLTEEGELSIVTEYLLKRRAEGASDSTLRRCVQSVCLLIDYLDANHACFSDPKRLFQSFVQRLYGGTIGSESGLDPSGLYWVPSSEATTDKLVLSLVKLSDWIANKLGVEPLNPLCNATSHEQRLNYAAWFRRNQNDYLGHIKDKSQEPVVKRARTLRQRHSRNSFHSNEDTPAFPEKEWPQFFKSGIGETKDPRVALRDKLVLLLMHGGGLRESEALTLWVTDVFENPEEPDSSIVRIHHEIDGTAPNDWKSRRGVCTRQAYLQEEFSRVPRINMVGTQHLGWKSRIFDNSDDRYIQVQWFPTVYGKLFMMLWRDYLKYRASIPCEHPYAFISFHTKTLGTPYTLNAFNCNYRAGLGRIGLAPNKTHGLSPHGHRHNYGRRLKQAKLGPLMIKRCMHHSSLDSQLIYTQESQRAISLALNEASQQLENTESSEQPLSWKSLLQYGFEDIDPQGYFSGKSPLLRSR
ncbi:gamma-mobile-trio recombinase GmtY [Aeromonas sp. A04]|uniref:gamma-mobile-trio recombinase GmtY n=1 Tax=Aeromonas sp. A04 TaxID=3398359 RepID=UPI0039F72D7B